MSDFNKLFEDMMAQGQKIARELGPEFEKFQAATLDGMSGEAATLPKDFMEMILGSTFNAEGLDATSRLLAMIAGMTVQGAPVEEMFKSTVRHALKSGARRQQIAEVITQMSLLCGVAPMSRALEFAHAEFDQTGEAKT
ncbi:MAG: carboxymuconolactone decarboxylase family protein [Paracoccaceae bacterium]